MGLLTEIQNDLVNSSKKTSTALRNARVLAYQLKNQALKNWISLELDGYSSSQQTADQLFDMLPPYRTVPHSLVGDVASNYQVRQNVPIVVPELTRVIPKNFRVAMVHQGIPTLETLIDSAGNTVSSPWPDYLTLILNEHICKPQGYTCSNVRMIYPKNELDSIVNIVRDRLLTFILELRDANPEIDANDTLVTVDTTQVNRLVQQFIIQDGGSINMSTFDQSHQNLYGGSQYNAAGDINFDNVQNATQVSAELSKLLPVLQEALKNAQMDEEVKIDAEGTLRKAITASNSPNPDQSKILGHLKSLQTLIQGVASIAGIGVLLQKAIEAVQHIHP